MDVAGVALATVISETLSALLILTCLMRAVMNFIFPGDSCGSTGAV